ncbi:hypothetical protein ACFLZ5_00880 [Thermodesulfobacteriota bacterium]
MREVFLTLSLLLLLTNPVLGGNTNPTSGNSHSYYPEWIKVYEEKTEDIHKAFADINTVMVKPDADFCSLRGLLYMGKCRYDMCIADIHTAIDDINKSIEVKPDADFYNLHELVYLDKDLYDRAVDDLNKAFADINKVLVKRDADFCTLHGCVYLGRRGCYDEAINDINKAFADINKSINLNL